jgi:hypothetical protein
VSDVDAPTQPGAEQSWRQLLVAVGAPWLVARMLVFAGYVVARAVDHHALTSRPYALRQGLLAWDGGFYESIAAHGYRGSPHEALRFFPLYPLLGRMLWPFSSYGVGAALVLLANVLALAAGVLLYQLVLAEKRDPTMAARAVWLLMLVPPAFSFVFGYSESLFVVLTLVVFLGMRRGNWWLAAAAALLAGATRPVGVLLVVPVAVEIVRQRRAIEGTRWLGAAASLVAPAVGSVAYLTYVNDLTGEALAPYRIQSDLRGGWVDPVTRLFRGFGDLVGKERFGDGLHVPFVIVALVLVVLTFRYWPAAYGAYASVAVVVALSASNLNSFERYAFAAFPLVLTLAVVARPGWREQAVLAICGGGLVALTALALLGAYVP